MSVINRFHLQSLFSQLQPLINSIHSSSDLLTFFSLLEQTSSLLLDLNQSVRIRDNKYGTQLPYILICKIFTYFNDMDMIRYGEWICYHWYQALNSSTRKHLIRPIKLPGKAVYLRKAQHGDAWAQAKLAECYQRGIGVTKDEEEGKKWAMRSVDQGDAEGQAALGYYYSVVEKNNLQEGIRLLQLSVSAGNARGHHGLAYCYGQGIGVEKDVVKSLHHYRIAAIQGYCGSQAVLGHGYSKGLYGLEKNLKEGFRWTQLAALQGYSDSQFNLYRWYRYGKRVSQNFQKAFEWCQLAAYSNHLEAQCEVGYFYDEGIGINKNGKLACHWYTLAAQSGFARAQYNLGAWYYNSNQDNEALKWLKLAAEQGDEDAKKKLQEMNYDDIGNCYGELDDLLAIEEDGMPEEGAE